MENVGKVLPFTMAILALTGCAADLPSAICDEWDFDCYILHTVKTRDVVRGHIAYWSNVHLIGQVLIILASMVATVMLALQGDKNQFWTRPIGLVATALVTGITSGLVSLHVPENVDKLVDIYGNMTTTVNEFSYEAEKLKEGRTKDQLEAAYRSDAGFRGRANDLTKIYVDSHSKTKTEMLKLSGTAARLNTTSTALPASAQPSKQ
jgi:hypothetical protein